MKPGSPPQWIQFIQRNQNWFKATDKVLTALFAARGGGPLALGLAGFSAVGTIVDAFFPSESSWEGMRRLALYDADLPMGGFFCDILLKRPHRVSGVSQFGISNLIWADGEGEALIGAMYGGTKFSDGPFLHATDGALETFFAAVRETAWMKGKELRLAVTKGDSNVWRAAGRFTLEPLDTLGPYFGRKQPAEFAARLAKYPPGQRTVVMRGPSGVGKSVLARHVSRILGGPDARTLKVSSEALKQCKSSELASIVRCLQPTVLLIDDLKIDDDSKTDFLLDLLEALRSPNTITFVTVMTKFADKEPGPGDWHAPGMRPGRVDEFWSFSLPDPPDRRLILTHYAAEYGLDLGSDLLDALVHATENLTGAYLANVVLRLATFGTDHWEDEVRTVFLSAPAKDAVEKSEGSPRNLIPR